MFHSTIPSTFEFPPKHVTGPRPPVMFYDRPMGTGKTRDLLKGFDPATKYLVVHEYLDQCQDVIDNPSGVHFEQPTSTASRTKGQHLEQLVRDGCNIVTTHALYPSLVEIIREGRLDDYAIIIDETPDPLRTPQGPLKGTWEALIRDGYATVDRLGKVTPQEKWYDNLADVRDSLNQKLLDAARAGILYVTDARNLFIIPIPVELLTAGNSLTIMTFMAEGSVLSAYLDRVGIPYVINRDFREEAKLRSEIRRWVTVKDIPALRDVALSATGQTKSQGRASYVKVVQKALANLRFRQLPDVDLKNILVGCIKSNWYREYDEGSAGPFAKNSRMFGANWTSASIRGLNAFRHCSVVISLYDYHLHPAILEWLGKERDRRFKERYALSELLQFIYRSRIRCRTSISDPTITVYLPSDRMRRILLDWVNSDVEPEDRLKVSR